jgi:hypothetical protein
MGQGPDLCKEIGKEYRVAIEKDVACCRLFINGQFAHGFEDTKGWPGSIPSSGKVGFRAIGHKVIADISNFRVEQL